MRVPPTISHANHHRRPSERRPGAGILHVGRRFDRGTSTSTEFAVAVTGQPWNRSERADLVRVLDAYLTLAHEVRTVQATQPPACRAAQCVR
jgi:hypothetical protein